MNNIIKLKPNSQLNDKGNYRAIKMALANMCLTDLFQVIDIVNCDRKGKARIPKRQRKVDLVDALLFLSPQIVADAINEVVQSKRVLLKKSSPYSGTEYEEDYEAEDEFDEIDDEGDEGEESDDDDDETDFDEEEEEFDEEEEEFDEDEDYEDEDDDDSEEIDDDDEEFDEDDDLEDDEDLDDEEEI